MGTIFGDKVTLSHALGSCAFNDAASLGAWPGASRVRLDDLAGWGSTADLNVIKSSKGTGDGDYLATRFPAKSRLIMASGYVVVPGRAALDSVWDLLSIQAFPVDLDIVLTRYEPVPKYVTARVAGPIEQVQYFPAEGALRFEVPLICADPFKYDAVNTLSGSAGVAGVSTGGRVYPRTYPLTWNITAAGSGNSITLFNVGTAKSYPIINIHGPLPSGWRVENSTTGDEEAFAVDLLSSDILVIDNQQKSALFNGAPVSGLLAGTWWPLARGSNTIRLFGNYDAAAGFTVSAKSAWR